MTIICHSLLCLILNRTFFFSWSYEMYCISCVLFFYAIQTPLPVFYTHCTRCGCKPLWLMLGGFKALYFDPEAGNCTIGSFHVINVLFCLERLLLCVCVIAFVCHFRGLLCDLRIVTIKDTLIKTCDYAHRTPLLV